MPKTNKNNNIASDSGLCTPLAVYSRSCVAGSSLQDKAAASDIKVIELFAGVGGFRIGLERASARFHTVWNNQWEPSTKRQDASVIYCKRFGSEGHSNADIATVDVACIPDADVLVGGFPCQDYSVATTLRNSGGIQGKKGVLWWQIHRILSTHPNPPQYLILENVDRLLNSPAAQRGRDFAIILASLSDLGYCVEWRVINAADYGMPQRRRRTYMFAWREDSEIGRTITDAAAWIRESGVMASAFPVVRDENPDFRTFAIEGDLQEVTASFNSGKKLSPFRNSGIMMRRNVLTASLNPYYSGPVVSLGDIMIDETMVPGEFFIPEEELPKWEYLKGSKSERRVNKTTGFEYNYTEGSMVFPDKAENPSRTIITGEGGASPSRFKHVVRTLSGRYRRLTPLELERLNMFPDNHTEGASDVRRAFLMGNALVTGIVERIGVQLERRIFRG